jgi:hypothetical protein
MEARSDVTPLNESMGAVKILGVSSKVPPPILLKRSYLALT